MSEWEEVRLGDVCEITSSKRIFAKEYGKYGVPFYRGKEIIEKHKGSDVSTELFISLERFLEIKDRFGVPKKGDILLTSVGTIGIPYYVIEEEFYFKDGNLTWFKNFNKSESKFIYFWLHSDTAKHEIDIKCIGSTQKALTIETLKKFQLMLPPLPEQKAIAKTLSCLDDKIELNNRINKNLEETAQAIFKHWFVDFEFPDENGLPYKSSGGEMVDSEMGEIPEGWRVGTLGDITNIVMGQSPNGTSYNENHIGEVFYQGRAEFGWRFPQKRLYTSEPKRMADANSILLSVRAPVGDINVASEKCCIGRGLASISSKSNYNSYVLCLLKSLKNEFNMYNSEGTVFGSINKDTLFGIKVIIPNDKILLNFEYLVSNNDYLIYNNFIESQTLTTLRDTLLPKLMSGELRVPISR